MLQTCGDRIRRLDSFKRGFGKFMEDKQVYPWIIITSRVTLGQSLCHRLTCFKGCFEDKRRGKTLYTTLCTLKEKRCTCIFSSDN